MATPMIRQYGYPSKTFVFKASMVDLVNRLYELVEEVDNDTQFGRKVMELAGTKVLQFLNKLAKSFDDTFVSNSSSLDYDSFDRVWFRPSRLYHHVHDAKTPLGDAKKMTTLLAVLLPVLRTKLSDLGRARLVSEYTGSLIDSLTAAVESIPAQEEKKVLVRAKTQKHDKQDDDVEEEDEENQEEPQDESPQLVEKKVLYEPFIVLVAGAYREASRLQRILNTQNYQAKKEVKKQATPAAKEAEKKPENGVQEKKELPPPKPLPPPPADGWIKVPSSVRNGDKH